MEMELVNSRGKLRLDIVQISASLSFVLLALRFGRLLLSPFQSHQSRLDDFKEARLPRTAPFSESPGRALLACGPPRLWECGSDLPPRCYFPSTEKARSTLPG